MSREREERLIQGYLDRILTPAEVEEFDRLLVSDPEFRRSFVEAARHESFLEGSLKELSTPGPSASKSEAPVRTPTRHRLDRRFTRSGSSPWTSAIVAAGVLFAILLVAALAGSGTKAPKAVRPEPQARTKSEKAVVPAPPPAPPLAEPNPPRPDPKGTPDAARDEERERVRRIEDDIRRQQEELRKKQTPAAPETPPKPAPPQDPPKPEGDEKPPATQAAVAKVESAEADVTLITAAGRRLIQGAEDVLPGQGIEVTGLKGGAVVTFPDRTRLHLSPGTEITEIRVNGGKRVVVARGSVLADVTRQPKDQPMLFPTPHGDARVLGTTLRLLVDPDPNKGTRLEVTEGLVRLTRKSDAKAVEVPSGHFTVAATGVNLELRRSPITEIVLLPKDGRIKGSDDWKKVSDPDALSGVTLHSPRAWTSELSPNALKQGTLGYVEFVFEAEFDVEYTVWIRAKVGPNSDIAHDAVGLAVSNGTLITRCGFYTKQGIPDTHLFTAYYQQKGYWWGDVLDTPVGNPYSPVRIKFTGLDKPTLRMYPSEGPIRVDAIWLSTTQKQKPDADHPIPAAAGAKAKGK